MSYAPRVRHAAIVVAFVCSSFALFAQGPVAERAGSPPPAELAPAVSSLLAEGSVRVTTGDVPLEFWWARAVPLEHAPSASPTWRDVADGAVVGAVKVGADWNDIRGYGVKAGVYTLRFALQPANGDHMGISPFREFLLMSPAADDTTAEPAGYKGTVALSKKTVHRAHPSALSLDPPVTTKPVLSPVHDDLGLDGVVFAVPTAFQGRDTGTITFGLIVHGSIDS
jgi:hypothetical protein